MHPQVSDSAAPRSVSVGYARVLVSYLSEAGVDPRGLLGDAAADCLQQQDPLARCTLDQWHAWMAAAEQRLCEADLVPALAEHFKPWHAGLLGFMLMTSGSVQDVGRALVRFQHLLNDVYAVERFRADGRFHMRLQPLGDAASPRLARLMLTGWAVRLRWLTGRSDLRLDADFCGPAPRDVAPYLRIFGGRVRFGQPHELMSGDLAYATLPVVSHDPMTHRLLQGRASEQVASNADSFLGRAEHLVRRRLESGEATLELLAEDLKLAPRTLQRRLDEQGLHFRTLVEQVRRSQALHYLRQTRLPLLEIALALGFATPASFHRAFKRWTGTSPAAYRREHARPARALRSPAAQLPDRRS